MSIADISYYCHHWRQRTVQAQMIICVPQITNIEYGGNDDDEEEYDDDEDDNTDSNEFDQRHLW